MTLRERYERYFQSLGYVKIESRTSKYVAYKGAGRYVFLGKSGAVRVSTTASVSNSLSINIKHKLEAWEREQGLSS